MDFWAVISILIMVLGIVGMIYPIFPGTIVVFLGPLIYVIFNGFNEISIPVFMLIVILTILGSLVDNLVSILGSKKFGASKQGLIGALLGGIVGLILFQIPGFLIGQFLGVIAAEIRYGKEFKQSISAGLGVFIGYIFGYLLKIILGGTVLVLFAVLVIWK